MSNSERVKAMRKESGLSQANYSSMFNIPTRTLQDWEHGKRNPPDYVVDMMEKILSSEHIIEIANKEEPFPRLMEYARQIDKIKKKEGKKAMFKMTFKLDEERMERDGLDVEDAWKQIDEMLVEIGDIHMDEKGIVVADDNGTLMFFEYHLDKCEWFLKYVCEWFIQIGDLIEDYIKSSREMGIRCCYE